MKCPIDDTVLSLSERTGIQIDWCPNCRGAWLDRGELDKLIEWSPESEPEPGRFPDRDRGHRSPKKKRSSMLSDLFDF